jgi:hypothetical protein
MLPALTLWTGWRGFSVLRRQIFSGDRLLLGIKREAGVNPALEPCELVRSRKEPPASRAAGPASPGARQRARRRSGRMTKHAMNGRKRRSGKAEACVSVAADQRKCEAVMAKREDRRRLAGVAIVRQRNAPLG